MWDILVVNGIFQSLFVFVMKEPDYNITIMFKLLGLTLLEVQKEEIGMVNAQVLKLKYPVTVADNYG